MAKGSLFWGKGSGKLGEVVLSQLKGQQVSRAYQSKVANPRSTGQTNQRIRFANAVKFYKQATQALFKFAYEDKKKNESDYNAFMRKNANVAAYVTRQSYDMLTYPSVGNQFLLADGTLQELPFTHSSNMFRMSLGVQSITAAESMTVAALSEMLIAKYDFVEGDILTFVCVSNPEVSDINSKPSEQTSWLINQLIISTSDASTIKSVFKAQNGQEFNSVGSFWGIQGTSGQEQYLGSYANSESDESILIACALIHSRNVQGQTLRVSPSYLVNGKVPNAIYQASLQQAYRNAALNSWGRQQEAILQGTLAKNV